VDGRVKTPDRLAILLSNFHPQAEDSRLDRLEREEDQVSRLGRDFLSSIPPWYVKRLGSALETGVGSLKVQVKHEITRLLSGLPPDPVLFLLVTGHGIFDATAGPCLIARDVYLHWKEDGLVPFSWFVESLGAAVPRHAVIVFDVEFIEGHKATPQETARALEKPHWPHTLIVSDRKVFAGASMAGVMAGGLEGAAMDFQSGSVTVRSLLAFLKKVQAKHSGARLHAVTTLPEGRDQELVSAPPVSVAAGGGVWFEELETEPTGAARAKDSASVLPGRLKMKEEIGSGGFGTVIRAEQCDLGRDVAVKILQAGVATDQDSVTLFMREMRAVAHLRHRNIVTIYHSGRLPDGRLFYVMELLEGESLRVRLERDKRLRFDKALHFSRQILEGLTHAHAKGIIHRDIKPENIMLVPGDGRGERVVVLDFGVARWKEERSREGELRSSGTSYLRVGTPGYMAPEQVEGKRVDEAADIYSVGVLLCEMLTGTRPTDMSASQHVSGALVGSSVPGAARTGIIKALQPDPQSRFATAEEFLAQLEGRMPRTGKDPRTSPQPFMFLSSFSEEDSALFFGREDEMVKLIDRLLFTRAILLTGVSGVGKSSLLRAGVVPACRSMRMKTVYLPCRLDPVEEAIQELKPGAESIAAACEAAAGETGERILVIADQLESLYVSDAFDREQQLRFEDQLVELLDRRDLEVSVILSVRDDFLAHLAPLRRRLGVTAYNEFRMDLLTWEHARTAIVQPFRMVRVQVADDLLAVLHEDLVLSARQLDFSPLSEGEQIYPPHLQLACALLYESLKPREGELTLKHYKRIGRLQGILEGHLQSVLDRELEPDAARAARDIIKELVTAARTRAVRPDGQLRAGAMSIHNESAVEVALRVLGTARLIHPVTLDGETCWELVHDCLVDQALSWADRQDMNRKRSREVLRFNLLHSTPERPSLLNRRQVKALTLTPEVVAEVDSEFAAAPPRSRPPFTAAGLVRKSRFQHRLVTGVVTTVLCAALTALVVLGSFYWRDLARRADDLGEFELRLSAFDLDDDGRPVTVSPGDLPDLSWRLHEPGDRAVDPVGPAIPEEMIEIGGKTASADGFQVVSAPGGRKVLVIFGRHRANEEPCGPAVVTLEELPGFARGDSPEQEATRFSVSFPSCRASLANMVEVPEGKFYLGTRDPKAGNPLKLADLSTFFIDDREVSAGFLDLFAAASSGEAGAGLSSTPGLNRGSPHLPAANVDWWTARAYCLWMGKDLPSDAQWVKAARGGIFVDGDMSAVEANDVPERDYPWGDDLTGLPGGELAWNVDPGKGAPGPVDCCRQGASPYRALNMAGNVLEWTRDWWEPGFFRRRLEAGELVKDRTGPVEGLERTARGGYFASPRTMELTIPFVSHFKPGTQWEGLGFRCAQHSPSTSWVEMP